MAQLLLKRGLIFKIKIIYDMCKRKLMLGILCLLTIVMRDYRRFKAGPTLNKYKKKS